MQRTFKIFFISIVFLAITGISGVSYACFSDAQCFDGNDCTTDICVGGGGTVDGGPGFCQNTFNPGIPGCCLSDSDCPSDIACTDHYCDGTNHCQASPVPGCCVNDSGCDDDNACTVNRCANNVCNYGDILNCSDGDSCTIDSCDPDSGCLHSPKAGCCNSASECDDGDSCTTDSCAYQPLLGYKICTHGQVACNDGNPCTIDTCGDGGCDYAQKICFDGNNCTTDSCDPGSGSCVYSVIDNDNDGFSTCDGDCNDSDDNMYPGNPEVCDGKDNDCNNAIDDGFGSTTCGNGICEHTVQNCFNGQVTECDQYEGAQPEVCNLSDDDCDGVVDDGIFGGECGTTNVGACEIGKLLCVDGQMGCVDAVEPEDETCEGVDNDCDGAIDDHILSQDCDVTNQYGTCSGTIACEGGAWTGCSAETPEVEVCDGLDNDCDGAVDEGFGTTTCGVGACEATVDNCVDGVVQACVPGGGFVEVCDLVDNDCDGSIDEALGSTTCGVGACEVTVENCNNGVPQSCVPNPADVEVCDLIDNNCDGLIDENLGSTTCGVGACEVTVENCNNGVPQSCVPNPTGVEVCDLIDNDCDGAVDEGFGTTTCGVGACEATVDNCIDGVVQACAPGDGSAEVCDLIDNNCDGLIDENLGSTTCGVGACEVTVENCNNGVPQSCVPNPADVEVCDLIDNNCDGLIDENLGSTTCGVGACEATVDNCVDGVVQACAPGDGSAEVCDLIDNDCDGSIDEDGICGECQADTDCADDNDCTVNTCSPSNVCVIIPIEECCNGADDCPLSLNPCDVPSCVAHACVPTLTPGAPCDDGNQCTETDVCNVAGVCGGLTMDCNDDDECTTDACSQDIGECVFEDGACDSIEVVCEEEPEEPCDPRPCSININTDLLIDHLDLFITYPVNSIENVTVTSPLFDIANSTFTSNPEYETSIVYFDDYTGPEDISNGATLATFTFNPIITALVPFTVNATLHGDGGATTAGQIRELSSEVATVTITECSPDCIDGEFEMCEGEPIGVCNLGFRTCANGRLGICEGMVFPSDEICDGLDNDCDGLVDEDSLGELISMSCITECGEGYKSCALGSWDECIVLNPPEEVCDDGRDNDCDGLIDEDCVIICIPTPEICGNLRDDDCDDRVDEDCESICVAEHEICDGKDNDCDGQIDEDLGFKVCGVGECRVKVPSCIAGQEQDCTPETPEVDDICDNLLDDDCDGSVDENCAATVEDLAAKIDTGSEIYDLDKAIGRELNLKNITAQLIHDDYLIVFGDSKYAYIQLKTNLNETGSFKYVDLPIEVKDAAMLGPHLIIMSDDDVYVSNNLLDNISNLTAVKLEKPDNYATENECESTNRSLSIDHMNDDSDLDIVIGAVCTNEENETVSIFNIILYNHGEDGFSSKVITVMENFQTSDEVEYHINAKDGEIKAVVSFEGVVTNAFKEVSCDTEGQCFGQWHEGLGLPIASLEGMGNGKKKEYIFTDIGKLLSDEMKISELGTKSLEYDIPEDLEIDIFENLHLQHVAGGNPVSKNIMSVGVAYADKVLIYNIGDTVEQVESENIPPRSVLNGIINEGDIKFIIDGIGFHDVTKFGGPEMLMIANQINVVDEAKILNKEDGVSPISKVLIIDPNKNEAPTIEILDGDMAKKTRFKIQADDPTGDELTYTWTLRDAAGKNYDSLLAVNSDGSVTVELTDDIVAQFSDSAQIESNSESGDLIVESAVPIKGEIATGPVTRPLMLKVNAVDLGGLGAEDSIELFATDESLAKGVDSPQDVAKYILRGGKFFSWDNLMPCTLVKGANPTRNSILVFILTILSTLVLWMPLRRWLISKPGRTH